MSDEDLFGRSVLDSLKSPNDELGFSPPSDPERSSKPDPGSHYSAFGTLNVLGDPFSPEVAEYSDALIMSKIFQTQNTIGDVDFFKSISNPDPTWSLSTALPDRKDITINPYFNEITHKETNPEGKLYIRYMSENEFHNLKFGPHLLGITKDIKKFNTDEMNTDEYTNLVQTTHMPIENKFNMYLLHAGSPNEFKLTNQLIKERYPSFNDDGIENEDEEEEDVEEEEDDEDEDDDNKKKSKKKRVDAEEREQRIRNSLERNLKKELKVLKNKTFKHFIHVSYNRSFELNQEVEVDDQITYCDYDREASIPTDNKAFSRMFHNARKTTVLNYDTIWDRLHLLVHKKEGDNLPVTSNKNRFLSSIRRTKRIVQPNLCTVAFGVSGTSNEATPSRLFFMQCKIVVRDNFITNNYEQVGSCSVVYRCWALGSNGPGNMWYITENLAFTNRIDNSKKGATVYNFNFTKYVKNVITSAYIQQKLKQRWGYLLYNPGVARDYVIETLYSNITHDSKNKQVSSFNVPRMHILELKVQADTFKLKPRVYPPFKLLPLYNKEKHAYEKSLLVEHANYAVTPILITDVTYIQKNERSWYHQMLTVVFSSNFNFLKESELVHAASDDSIEYRNVLIELYRQSITNQGVWNRYNFKHELFEDFNIKYLKFIDEESEVKEALDAAKEAEAEAAKKAMHIIVEENEENEEEEEEIAVPVVVQHQYDYSEELIVRMSHLQPMLVSRLSSTGNFDTQETISDLIKTGAVVAAVNARKNCTRLRDVTLDIVVDIVNPTADVVNASDKALNEFLTLRDEQVMKSELLSKKLNVTFQQDGKQKKVPVVFTHDKNQTDLIKRVTTRFSEDVNIDGRFNLKQWGRGVEITVLVEPEAEYNKKYYLAQDFSDRPPEHVSVLEMYQNLMMTCTKYSEFANLESTLYQENIVKILSYPNGMKLTNRLANITNGETFKDCKTAFFDDVNSKLYAILDLHENYRSLHATNRDIVVDIANPEFISTRSYPSIREAKNLIDNEIHPDNGLSRVFRVISNKKYLTPNKWIVIEVGLDLSEKKVQMLKTYFEEKTNYSKSNVALNEIIPKLLSDIDIDELGEDEKNILNYEIKTLETLNKKKTLTLLEVFDAFNLWSRIKSDTQEEVIKDSPNITPEERYKRALEEQRYREEEREDGQFGSEYPDPNAPSSIQHPHSESPQRVPPGTTPVPTPQEAKRPRLESATSQKSVAVQGSSSQRSATSQKSVAVQDSTSQKSVDQTKQANPQHNFTSQGTEIISDNGVSTQGTEPVANSDAEYDVEEERVFEEERGFEEEALPPGGSRVNSTQLSSIPISTTQLESLGMLGASTQSGAFSKLVDQLTLQREAGIENERIKAELLAEKGLLSTSQQDYTRKGDLVPLGDDKNIPGKKEDYEDF